MKYTKNKKEVRRSSHDSSHGSPRLVKNETFSANKRKQYEEENYL